MRQTFEYDSEKDLCEVDQFGFVDITKSIQNGYVPGTNSSAVLDYDGCEDPSSIMGKPSDVFEAMRIQDTLMDSIKEKGSSYNKSEGSYNKDEN